MISKEEQQDILEFVQVFAQETLDEIVFDENVKEPGHSFHGPFEDVLGKKLLSYSDDFVKPEKTRDLADILYKGNPINIKFGYKKNGQPNVCSMHKLFDALHTNKIDSYYIISVDADGCKVLLFDVFDNLDRCTFNYGVGQMMLSETKINKEGINPNVLTKAEKIHTMASMFRKAYYTHIAKKKKQQNAIEAIAESYEVVGRE